MNENTNSNDVHAAMNKIACNCSGAACHCGGACHGGMCGGMCGRGGAWGHRGLLRVVLALVVLAIVFKMGVEVGEFKNEFGLGGHGPRQERMMQGDYRNMMGGTALEGASAFDPLLGF